MTVPPDLQESIKDAFTCALMGDRERLIEHLADIAGWGPMGIHTACWGWAGSVRGFWMKRRGWFVLVCSVVGGSGKSPSFGIVVLQGDVEGDCFVGNQSEKLTHGAR